MSATCINNAPPKVSKRLLTLKNNSSYSKISSVLNDKETFDYISHGYPPVKNYMKEVKNRIKEISFIDPSEVPTYDIANNRVYARRTLIAKAERAIRYEFHIKELDELRSRGVQNVWITSHANCSKRCERWQGKTYTLDGQTRVIDGKTFIPIETAINVYVKTKTGKIWRNGLFGFNCRHKAIPYTSNRKK